MSPIDPSQATPIVVHVSVSSIELIKISAFALWGGLVHALIAHRLGQTKSLTDVVILVLISAFGGIIMGLLSLHFWPYNDIFLMISSGMGGYLGIEALTLFVNFIKNKFNLK